MLLSFQDNESSCNLINTGLSSHYNLFCKEDFFSNVDVTILKRSKSGQSTSGIIMRELIEISSQSREALVDITSNVKSVVRKSGIKNGLISVYAQGATSAIMIQENWDDSVQTDVVNLLRKMIPQGVWLHDRQDGNGDSHLKAGIVGPSETIPLIDGKLGLSQWQNIFFCEFDGPRRSRTIVCTILADSY